MFDLKLRQKGLARLVRVGEEMPKASIVMRDNLDPVGRPAIHKRKFRKNR